MGLERLACLMQGVDNLFEVDTVRNIMLAVSEKANVKYGEDEKKDISLRVITDHIRSTTFLICDGVVPSNEGRGYVLRRLLRRAARHGRLLGIKGTFLADIVPVVARENFSEYPELTEKLDYIKKVVAIEEERFAATIDSGLDILDSMIKETKAAGADTLPGEDVFKLSDTFGFPVDLTREIALEAGLGIDEEGFEALLAEQKKRARAARAAMGDLGWTSRRYSRTRKASGYRVYRIYRDRERGTRACAYRRRDDRGAARRIGRQGNVSSRPYSFLRRGRRSGRRHGYYRMRGTQHSRRRYKEEQWHLYAYLRA